MNEVEKFIEVMTMYVYTLFASYANEPSSKF